MQPLQYELRCPAAKHNSITRTAAGARNLYAAITLRFAAPRAHSCSHYIAFCSIRWLTRMYLRTWQQNMTTIMQPLHCDLQRFNKGIELRTHEQAHVAERQGGTDSTLKRPLPHTLRTRAALHRRLQPLYTAKHKFRAPATSATRVPCNIHAAIPMRFAAPRTHIHAAITMRLASTRYRTPWENRVRVETIQAAPASHRSCPASPAAATLHGKSTRFCAPASSPTRVPCNIHAAITMCFLIPTHTFMQPLHCDWHPHVAEHHWRTYYALKRSKPHPPHTGAALHRRLQPLYTEKHKFRAPASSPHESHATFMQRFQCVLQQHATHACSHYNAIGIHTLQTTMEEPITRWNDPSRTRLTQDVPFIAGCSHFTRKKHKVSCSGFLPNTSPMQPSCSHHNAFSSTTHTFMEPLQCDISIHTVHNTIEEPITRWNDPSRTRLTQELPFIAGCSHFTRKNTRFGVPASSPTRVPCNLHAAITMRFAASLPSVTTLRHHHFL